MIQGVTGNMNISFLSAGFSGIAHMRYYYTFRFIAYFISFLGNSCLVLVIITDRHLQTHKHMTVFKLSLIDVCKSITEIIKQLDAFLFANQLNPYGLCLCNMHYNILFVSMHSITLNILSFERLAAVCLPLRYQIIVTHRSVLVIIGALWTITLMQTIIRRLSFFRTSIVIIRFCNCRSNVPSMSVLFQVINMFPVFCIIILYTCIVITLFRYRSSDRLTVVAVISVPTCLTYVLWVLLRASTTINILYLTSLLTSMLNHIIYTFLTKEFMASGKKAYQKTNKQTIKKE